MDVSAEATGLSCAFYAAMLPFVHAPSTRARGPAPYLHVPTPAGAGTAHVDYVDGRSHAGVGGHAAWRWGSWTFVFFMFSRYLSRDQGAAQGNSSVCCCLFPCQFRAAVPSRVDARPGTRALASGALGALNDSWMCRQAARQLQFTPNPTYGASTTRPPRACNGRGGVRVLHAHPHGQREARQQAPTTATAKPPSAATATTGAAPAAPCMRPPVAAHHPAGAHNARGPSPPQPPATAGPTSGPHAAPPYAGGRRADVHPVDARRPSRLDRRPLPPLAPPRRPALPHTPPVAARRRLHGRAVAGRGGPTKQGARRPRGRAGNTAVGTAARRRAPPRAAVRHRAQPPRGGGRVEGATAGPQRGLVAAHRRRRRRRRRRQRARRAPPVARPAVGADGGGQAEGRSLWAVGAPRARRGRVGRDAAVG